MNLTQIKDAELLNQIKNMVRNERNLLVQILNHLREVERRKLFSELGYRSLFEYAVHELKYSDGQAGRRIQAMRLIKEIPEIEAKVQSGVLTLSHLSRAQSFFREKENQSAQSLAGETAVDSQSQKTFKKISAAEKIDLLNQLENTSARETEKILIKLNPPTALPKESERILSETHSEIKFIADKELQKSLDEVRTLLGVKSLGMSFSQLVSEMARLSITALKSKKIR